MELEQSAARKGNGFSVHISTDTRVSDRFFAFFKSEKLSVFILGVARERIRDLPDATRILVNLFSRLRKKEDTS